MSLLWGVVGILSGILIFIATPILAGPSLGVGARQRILDAYTSMAMVAFGRAQLLRRLHGGYTIRASEYDSKHEAEKFSLGGEAKNAEDVANLMSRLHNKAFGMVYEDSNVVIDPMHAEVGEFHSEHVAAGNHTAVEKVTDQDGETREREVYTPDLPIPSKTRLVDLVHISSIVPGSAKLGDTEQAEEYVKISLEGFKSASTMEYMIVLMAFAVGFGVVFLAMSQGGSLTSTVNMTIMPVPGGIN